MSGPDKISMKAFWEAVEQRLAARSASELRAILRAMAHETPPTGRRAFLDKLDRIDDTTFTTQQILQQEDLLADIEDLIQELEAAMAGAERWEEQYGWNEYDEEDSLGPYERFVEPLVELFDRAEAAFDYGDLSLARAAYETLFDALNREDDYGRGVGLLDLTGVDPAEAGARYLRATYETEAPERRPEALFGQMQGMRLRLMVPRPMLDDLLQISTRSLPDRERFLGEWIAFLRAQTGADADAWLREAIRLSQGTQGLAALARDEGEMHPRAYLDWFTALEQEGRHREVLLAAQEALQALPAGLAIRAAIADHLCAAAARLEDTEALRAGRWEAFLAIPTLARLLDLRDAAPAGTERTALMRQATEHVRHYLARRPSYQGPVGWDTDSLERSAWIDRSVLAHACLLAGDFEAAHRLVADEKPLGWSSSTNPQGLVVPFFLVLLSGRALDALPPNLSALWQSGLTPSAGPQVGGGQDPLRRRLERAYAEQLAMASLSSKRQESLLSWCLDVARRRVDAIVDNQYRGSYGKAAVLTAACAEVLRLRGDKAAAASLVDEIRDRFPRHRAFQAELKTAVQLMERGLQ